jgi:hypothetical protein
MNRIIDPAAIMYITYRTLRGYKEMTSILADQYIAPSYRSPNAGGGGEFQGLSQWVQLYTGAQINFADLTPHLTYVEHIG